ncbi:MAG: class I SAM-dependent methyltransferase [Anaerolineae bacterium]|nr:class I SAM-dependent methyltransferase [Anaerolineae bacterium]
MMKAADFGPTVNDYVTYRAGFPDQLYDRLAPYGIGQPDQAILDLGTGTGTIANALARRGCSVVGFDHSFPMLRAAHHLGQDAGQPAQYVTGKAEQFPYKTASFDCVIAGQCWHWFDGPVVARSCRHLLVPGGRLVIAHFDWLPLPGNVVEASEQMVLEVSPAWGGSNGHGIHAHALPDIQMAGFVDIETFSCDVPVEYSHEAWRGRVRASAGIGVMLSPERIEQFDSEHAAMLADRFPADPLSIPHRLFAIVCTSP